ncbi:replication initiation protein [Photobacterium leiognathi]|uniref:replication initiation protein n=1 Tax=Photobacterium leiognathi TaxID=553611 RepID=UPI0029815E86|nr:replication initiation protein [Photobacterium leiognathi]
MTKKKINKFREPNKLTPVNYGAIEQNLYALILRQISISVWAEKKQNTFFSNKEITLSIDELLFWFNCSKSNLANNVAPAAKSMVSKSLIYNDGVNDYEIKFLDSVEYYSNSGLYIKVNANAIGIIKEDIPKDYSEIDITHYFKLKGKYSRRLLKIISQWKSIHNKVITLELDEYRKILGVPENRYHRTESFIKNCISQPMLDVISCSSGEWTAFDDEKKGYELHRKGRSFSSIKIMLNKDASEEKNDLPF